MRINALGGRRFGSRELAYESQILWSLWHKAKVVNVWRGRIYVDNYTFCNMYALRCQKQLSHHYWFCYHGHCNGDELK